MNDQFHHPLRNFECARETIMDLMALYTHEFGLSTTTEGRRVELIEERTRLLAELRSLQVDDHAEIARIRREYGDRIRDWRRATGNRIKAV